MDYRGIHFQCFNCRNTGHLRRNYSEEKWKELGFHPVVPQNILDSLALHPFPLILVQPSGVEEEILKGKSLIDSLVPYQDLTSKGIFL